MSAKKKTGFDVICVGSATVDAFVRLPVDLCRIKHGSKNVIDDIEILTGGGGTNVAVGISRLGLKAGFIGEMGDDLSAAMVSHELTKEGVKILIKEHSRHRTAYSIVLEAKGKDRSILVYKGASSFLHSHELPKRMKTDWFYFGSMMGRSYETMERLARIAKRDRIRVFFNPSSYLVRQGRGFLKQVLDVTTILSLNKEEAQTLLGSRSRDHESLLKGLHRLGPEVCIITDGSRGTHVYDGKSFYFKRPKKVRPIDTTGAGDAFGAGFLSGWIINKGLPLEKRIPLAMGIGMCNAESVIQQTGAKRGLLTRRKALALAKGR